MKEKLIELFWKARSEYGDKAIPFEQIADYLIANNVVVREKGEWEETLKNNVWWYRCSVCGGGVYDGVYKKHKCPPYCFHCGADLRGDKNEIN